MAYNYLDQPVLASCLGQQSLNDSFYFPSLLNHTGFGYDGLYYSDGVPTTQMASWASEPLNTLTRGSQVAFPLQVLVIVNAASIAIIDATNLNLDLWLGFLYADSLGFTDNFTTSSVNVSGYTGSSVSYANGKVCITMIPDQGSGNTSPNVLTFDFVQDSIYCITRM